jgi:hypothetical protein
MKFYRLLLFSLIFLVKICESSAQQFNCYITNDTLISPTVYQFDIYVVATTTDFYLRTIQTGLKFNPAFIASGSTVTGSVIAGSTELISYRNVVRWNYDLSSFSIQMGPINGCFSTPDPVSHNYMITGIPKRISTYRITSDIPFNCAKPNISMIRPNDPPNPSGVLKMMVTSWDGDCLALNISSEGEYTHFDSNTLYGLVHNLQISVQNSSSDSIAFCEGHGIDSFSVNAISNGSLLPINYQWYLNGNPVSNNSTFQGATTRTLVITNPIGLNSNNILTCKAWQCSPGLIFESGQFKLTVLISDDHILFTEDACDTRMGISHQPVFHLKTFLQGYYSATGFMDNEGRGGALYLSGNSIDPDDADSLQLQLVDPSNKTLIASSKAILKTDGNVRFEFQTNYSGSCYLCVKHRNAIETWSSVIINLSLQNSYDFTNSSQKAFGSNEVQNKDGSWAFYSGDVIDSRFTRGQQDGIISEEDFYQVESIVNIIGCGYLGEDLTGDLLVEAQDYLIEDNNRNHLIMAIRP